MFGIFRSPLVAICLVVIGLFFFISGTQSAKKFAALRDHGKVAKAEVVKLEWHEKKSNHADSLYTAQVRFTTADGKDVRASVGVPADVGRAMRSNSAPSFMNVRYLPEAPTTLEDVNKDDSSDAMKGVGRIMALVGLLMLGLRFFFGKSDAR